MSQTAAEVVVTTETQITAIEEKLDMLQESKDITDMMIVADLKERLQKLKDLGITPTADQTPNQEEAPKGLVLEVQPDVEQDIIAPTDSPDNQGVVQKEDQPVPIGADSQAAADLVAPTTTSAAVIIDQVKKEALERKFEETINNPRFWEKETRYTELMNAMVIPVFDDRDLQQFFNHAMDDLTNAAAKESARTGRPVVLPTEEEGKAEALRRKAVKEKELAAKAARKLAKQAK